MADLADNRPDFLPDIISFGGDWNAFIEAVYGVFINDFIRTQPICNGVPVGCSRKMDNGKEASFWHITSETERETGQRIPDIQRAEKVPWAKPIIEHTCSPEIKAWYFEEGGGNGTRLYIWLYDYDYVVILQKRSANSLFLVTAYHVSGNSTRRRLEKKFDKRIS